MATATEPRPEPLLWDLTEVKTALGLSRETIEDLAGKGEIKSRLVGRRRKYLVSSIRDYVARLEADGPDR